MLQFLRQGAAPGLGATGDAEEGVYRLELDTVSQAFATGDALPFDVDDALAQAAALAALAESARTGRPVALRTSAGRAS